MSDRATRPLDQGAASAADNRVYEDHASDPRPNALYDADGNRKPLDPDDPDQADIQNEWVNAYEANGGQTEASDDSGSSPDDVVLPCGQKAQVDPLISGDPVDLDDSDDDFDDESEPEDDPEEEEPEEDDADDEEQAEQWYDEDPDSSTDEPQDGVGNGSDGSPPLKSSRVVSSPSQDSPDSSADDSDTSSDGNTDEG